MVLNHPDFVRLRIAREDGAEFVVKRFQLLRDPGILVHAHLCRQLRTVHGGLGLDDSVNSITDWVWITSYSV